MGSCNSNFHLCISRLVLDMVYAGEYTPIVVHVRGLAVGAHDSEPVISLENTWSEQPVGMRASTYLRICPAVDDAEAAAEGRVLLRGYSAGIGRCRERGCDGGHGRRKLR